MSDISVVVYKRFPHCSKAIRYLNRTGRFLEFLNINEQNIYAQKRERRMLDSREGMSFEPGQLKAALQIRYVKRWFRLLIK